MIDRTLERLAELASKDPVAAPLAVLQEAALRATLDRGWEEGVPEPDADRLRHGFPVLQRQTLRVDPDRQRRLLAVLVSIAARSGQPEPVRLDHALAAGLVEPVELLDASIRQDNHQLAEHASQAAVDPGLLSTLGQLATIPLLQACGRKAASLLEELRWEASYCPVCAAWPTVAELRGLERKRWLRCGRCGAGWWCRQQRCSFCASEDHRLHGYLAPEANRESQRAETCDGCGGYLKAITTFSALPASEIAVYDLTSLELDIAALEQGYGRPEQPGFPLEVTIEPLRRRALWLPGRR